MEQKVDGLDGMGWSSLVIGLLRAPSVLIWLLLVGIVEIVCGAFTVWAFWGYLNVALCAYGTHSKLD